MPYIIKKLRTRKLNSSIKILLGLILIIMIFVKSHNYFLLYHLTIEIFSIGTGIILLIVAAYSAKFKLHENDHITILGVSYGFVSLFDFIHTISYQGMNIIPGNTTNLATQLWVIARYIESISILIFCYYIYYNKKVEIKSITSKYIVVSLILILSVFVFDIFPESFNEETGLTLFKVVSEYTIGIILIACIFLIRTQKNKMNYNIYKALTISLVYKVISELCFTLYIGVYDNSNIIGHIFKGISFYIFAKSIVLEKIVEPYALLNKEKKILRAIINSSADGILVLDDNSEVVYVNTGFEKIWNDMNKYEVSKETDCAEIARYITKQLKNP